MAKITLSPEAKALVTKLRARVAELETENAALKVRRAGVRSSGVEDRYTAMEAPELRPLVIQRGGDPDEICRGYHSRQRAIQMREWLRAHPGKKKAEVVAKPTRRVKEAPAPVVKKKVRKPEPAPVVKKKVRSKTM